MKNSKLNTKNGYEAIVLDAEDFLRISDMPLWRMFFETESRLMGFSASQPNARRIAVFEPSQFGAENDVANNISMLRLMLVEKAKSLGWKVIAEESEYWNGIGSVMADPSIASSSMLLVSGDRRSFGYLSERVDVFYGGDVCPRKWTVSDFRALYGFEPSLYWRFLTLAGWSDDPAGWIDEGKALERLRGSDDRSIEANLTDLFDEISIEGDDLRQRLALVIRDTSDACDLTLLAPENGGDSEG